MRLADLGFTGPKARLGGFRAPIYLLRVLTLALAAAAVPSAAQAGTLSTSVGDYGEERLTYQAQGDPASVIVVRTLADGQLLLTDSRSKITFTTPDSPLKCRLHGDHTAICRQRSSFPIQDVTIHAGNHGDVIDARFLIVDGAELEGGAGNDTLLAPQRVAYERDRATVTGGGGHNVIVGNSHTTVSYREAQGPVTVDLTRGFGVARGEHDHLVGVTSVEGTKQGRNILVGSRSGGHIWGGPKGNLIVTLSRYTSVNFEEPIDRRYRLHSTIVCLAPSTVEDIEPGDVATDRCRIGYMTLQLPMRSLSSAVLTLKVSHDEEAKRHVELLAGSAHTLVGEANYPPSISPRTVPCALNSTGRQLLRRNGRLHVLVKELYSWPTYPGPAHLWKIFSTVLRLARAHP